MGMQMLWLRIIGLRARFERIGVGVQDEMMELVELRTNRFTPFLPDDSQVNPGVYGAELAYWLSQQLASHGVITSYPESEDWGWYLQLHRP